VHSTVTFVESLGSNTHAYCTFPGVEDALTVELGGRSKIKTHDLLHLHVPAQHCYLFDADGHAFHRHANDLAQRAA
jgi:multiple sugar transport system ATP-binding protein